MIRIVSPVVLLLVSSCASAYQVASAPSGWPWNDPERSRSVETTSGELIYVTDRSRRGMTYSVERSTSLAAGKIQIGITGMGAQRYRAFMSGDEIGLPEYMAGSVDEFVKFFTGTPLAFLIENGVLTRERLSLLRYLEAGRSFQSLLSETLASQGSQDVLLYVHGFNNTFEHGAVNLFEVWNASGRISVPVLFSWPTGGRLIFGYLGDTQDADFCYLSSEGSDPAYQRHSGMNSITLMAHSRGVSLATDALRELMIEARGSGLSMRDTYQIENLILAAPDMDLGVMEQRLVAEAFGMGFGQINVYVNPSDNALGLSGCLYGAPRFGAMTPETMSEESKAVFRGVR